MYAHIKTACKSNKKTSKHHIWEYVFSHRGEKESVPANSSTAAPCRNCVLCEKKARNTCLSQLFCVLLQLKAN